MPQARPADRGCWKVQRTRVVERPSACLCECSVALRSLYRAKGILLSSSPANKEAFPNSLLRATAHSSLRRGPVLVKLPRPPSDSRWPWPLGTPSAQAQLLPSLPSGPLVLAAGAFRPFPSRPVCLGRAQMTAGGLLSADTAALPGPN